MGEELTADTMFGYLERLPEQFTESLGLDLRWAEEMPRRYNCIVVAGQGGSAIGGDVLRTYCQSRLPVPVLVNRDYRLPACVGPDSLVLAVSYSGNTEETLSAYVDALCRQAHLVAVTTGGKLAEWAAHDGVPVIEVPPGFMPRAAAGYLFAPAALLLERLRLLAGVSEEIQETARVLQERRATLLPAVPAERNEARQLAARLAGALPIIWGAAGSTEVAALRWKGQINENAKSPAYYNVFPELDHNEIVGFEAPEDLVRRLALVILRDRDDHERVVKRMAITADVVGRRAASISEVHSSGEGLLARLFSLMYVGDYTSTYLALEYGINPTPVQAIDELKARMAQ
ncbi:MAG: bifunctional phosphoglucose/phosphomannose isomerase [Syntrophomonadaceae bacterium]|jgi:glucose/mannose-6-phosphate isomerase|nr:bifunctional phosphoglucose/phosphomannose isomerase [Syntrophomonadaceae bacterium]MDH7497652.1 bifunctional phosphoglucose/phosphomannose isomerase [Syntrophomonadaceae bacterium]